MDHVGRGSRDYYRNHSDQPVVCQIWSKVNNDRLGIIMD